MFSRITILVPLGKTSSTGAVELFMSSVLLEVTLD